MCCRGPLGSPSDRFYSLVFSLGRTSSSYLSFLRSLVTVSTVRSLSDILWFTFSVTSKWKQCWHQSPPPKEKPETWAGVCELSPIAETTDAEQAWAVAQAWRCCCFCFCVRTRSVIRAVLLTYGRYLKREGWKVNCKHTHIYTGCLLKVTHSVT